MLVFLKASLVWTLIAVFAVLNGLLREALLVPWLGLTLALPLSGLTLSIIVFFLTYVFITWFGKRRQSIYVAIGLMWVGMTVVFEFSFGFFIAGKSWQEILQVFNLMSGDSFLLVLITTLLAPPLTAKMKRQS